MDISAISGAFHPTINTEIVSETKKNQGFDGILNNAMKLINDTNTLQNEAAAEKVKFALGESDNVHDLLIAEQKASMAIQYTVAVRNQVIQGYNTIMNMQI